MSAAQGTRLAFGKFGPQTDHVEQLGDPRRNVGSGDLALHGKHLGQRRTDGHARIERRGRVLKDHRGFAAQALQIDTAAPGHVDVIEDDLPGGNVIQAQNGAAQRALAAAGLADQPQRFTRANAQ